MKIANPPTINGAKTSVAFAIRWIPPNTKIAVAIAVSVMITQPLFGNDQAVSIVVRIMSACTET